MHYSVLSLLLITAPPAVPVSLTYKDQPLLDVIESRLALADRLVKKRENRLASPGDTWFRHRFYSRSLVDNVQPAFPVGLPGTVPLLEHSDPRVRCAALLIIQRWLHETQKSYKPIPESVLSKADWQRLRRALLDNIVNPKHKQTSLFAGEHAVEVFPSLAKTPLTQTEEKQLLQKLKSKDQRHQRQVLQMFLTVKPMRFPAAIQAPLRKLLESKSTERGRIVLLLQGLHNSPPELQAVVRDVLKRSPHAWPASRLALLLSRWKVYCPEVVPGLIAVFNQEVPPRGRMMGRGGMSFIVPDSPNRWTVLQERQQARQTLMTLPVRQPQVIPELMKMLDADDIETREMGVAAIARFGSGAIIAVPKLLTMNTKDNRPRGRIQILGPFGLGPAVGYSVRSIVGATLIDIFFKRYSRLLISTSSLVFDHLNQYRRYPKVSQ